MIFADFVTPARQRVCPAGKVGQRFTQILIARFLLAKARRNLAEKDQNLLEIRVNL